MLKRTSMLRDSWPEKNVTKKFEFTKRSGNVSYEDNDSSANKESLYQWIQADYVIWDGEGDEWEENVNA